MSALITLLPVPPLTASKVVANSAARLALTLEQSEGFAVVDADTGKTWMLIAGGTPATSGDWLQLGDRNITAADISDPENIVTSDFVAAVLPEALTATPVDNRLAIGMGWLSAKDYEAVGDGVADDTTKLQNLINAATSSGRMAFIPAGTYKITDALAVPSGTVIMGESWVGTEIVQTGSNKHGFVCASNVPWYGNIHIENLVITGPGKALTTGCGIYFDGSAVGATNGINNSTFRKIMSRRFNKGAYFHTIDNSLIEQCRFGNSTNENNIGLEITGNSNAVSLVSNTIFSSTLGLKISGGGAIGIRGLEMGGGGQTKSIEISGSAQVAIRDFNCEFWPVGESASNVCVDATAAGISVLIENSSIRSGVGAGNSGYSLAVGTGRVTVINSGLALTHNDTGNTTAIKLQTHYQSLLTGYNTPALVNIYHDTTGVYQTQAMLSQFPADAATPTAATSATRGRILWKVGNTFYDDQLMAAVRTGAGTFADANLLDYYTDKKSVSGTTPAFLNVANTFSGGTQRVTNAAFPRFSLTTSAYSGNEAAFVIPTANGGGATGTVSGDTLLKAYPGGALDFATSASGTQIVRGKFKATGMLHLVPMAEPTGAAGDIYYDSGSNKLRCHNGTIWNDLF